MIKKYLFVLGRSVQLAEAELKSVLGKRLLFSDLSLAKNLATIKSEVEPEKVADLINILGGTVKIAELVEYGDWGQVIYTDLKANPVRDIGFSSLDSRLKRNLIFDLKSRLKDEGLNIRAVLPREATFLNAAEIRSNKLIGKGREYVLTGDQIYKTIAQQDVEGQVERDYGKPRSNAVSGMVPPKLARMMVNLATSQIESSKPETRNSKQIQNSNDQSSKPASDFDIRISDLPPVVVDPFCGSGNILIEALALGYGVQGSDVSGGEVQKTTENLAWYIKEHPSDSSQGSPLVFAADAAHDDFLKDLTGPAVIVCEPFLGEPHKEKLSVEQARAEISGLADLYLKFLENAKQLSKSHQIENICLIFPSFELQNGVKRPLYQEIVDKIGSFGYTSLVGPYEYGRDYQIVKRDIVLLQSDKSKARS
jgi:tRNA G10  N-methylase Trm11